MNTELLRKVGLTEGEIRVYEALAHLGKSSTGPIMDKSRISSSKVYLILEKLVQKGLVTFIIENNVKKFQVANPRNIIEYLDKKQEELEKTKKESEVFIKEITSIIGKAEEESAQIYKGFAGMRVAFDNLLNELDKEDEFLFFAQQKEELENKRVVTFFKNLHLKRLEKGISSRGIADLSLKKLFEKSFKQKKRKMKFAKLSLPMAISIGKNSVIMNIWGDYPICFEVTSKRIAERYKEFFERVWNL
jgi:HTH-type transcriptional regulator, sugar sensing transcriptional regulator